MPLTPVPNQLGLASPQIGPWFSANTINLVAPLADLTVPIVNNQGAWDWHPPANGTLSLHVATPTRPEALSRLTLPSGKPAFADNSIVALFTLLPEVEDRLYRLTSTLPPADGSAVTIRPARARVRYFAIQLPETSAAFGGLWARLQPPLPANILPPQGSNKDAAEYLGLTVDGKGNLTNGAHPMADLGRPGAIPAIGSFEILLRFQPADNVILSAFDHRGRAVDPGAVASWWAAVAAQFPQLWADNLGANQRTCAVAAARTVHVASAHEGVLPTALASRVQLSVGILPVATGNPQIITFSSPPAAQDNAPFPLVAMLPSGTYLHNLTLWPAGNNSPARDFVRVTAVDVEGHLVGQSRAPDPNDLPVKKARAAHQDRPTTRVNVARSPGPALLSTIDAASAAGLATISLANATEVLVVAGTVDRDWGPVPGLAPPPPNPPPFPPQLPQPDVVALTGGNSSATSGQRVLIHMNLSAPPNPAPPGAWLRARSQGFNLDTGKHFAMDGGAGKVDNQGDVYLVVELPYGSNTGLLGMNFELTFPGGASRAYPEARFTAPAEIGGSALNFGQANNVILCEQGKIWQAGDRIESGTTLVQKNGNLYTLVNSTPLSSGQLGLQTITNAFVPGTQVELTQPAFVTTPDGAGAAALVSNGATANRTVRSGLGAPMADSQPFPGMERLDCVCTALNAGANAASATIFAAPSLRQYHETLRHQDGHPGSPAGIEVHGAGVSLNGPAAALFAEFARPRIGRNAVNLVTASIAGGAQAVPADPAGAGVWAAPLKTVAGSVEGDSGLGKAVTDPNNGYMFGQPYTSNPAQATDIKSWFDANAKSVIGPPLPPVPAGNQQTLAARAMDRLGLAAGFGCHEGATSLVSAFSRAEDFVYIETPALDDIPFGDPTDQVAVWGALKTRAQSNPRLRVIVCIAIEPMPGCPSSMKLVRDSVLLDAISALQANMGDRLAVFSPSAGAGRSVRLAVTSVVVDDVYALTGTTHLWRRGLSFDSSLAAAVFDEALTHGRPTDVRNFRRGLVAGALGLTAARVPDDPAELVTAIHILAKQGSARLAVETLVKPASPPTQTDIDFWNPAGGPGGPFNVAAWLGSLLQYSGDFNK